MMRGFDSIDSMNHEELLVRRKRGNKKVLIFLGIIIAAFFIIGILIGYFSRPGNGGSGGAAPSTDGNNFDYVKFVQENVNKDNIRENLRRYSSEPRLAGTPLDEKLAKTIEKEWRENGLEEVHLATYEVLLSFPNKSNPNVVQILNGSNAVQFESQKFEKPLTDHENNSNVVPPFNGHSPSGNVKGDVVYVNYGRIEDFEYVANNLSLNITGKIVIARYGKIFRGDKVKNAERFSAIAVILYSDPQDYNMDVNVTNTYPNSWWLPPTGIQRGTVGVDGDPQTPLYPSTSYAHRLSDMETDLLLPRIPSQPIGYGDAQEILSIMGGPDAPEDWQGGLNFTYRIGPGFLDQNNSTVRVIVNNNNEVRPVHNVIGYIKGKEEPDRYVLLGNHHDAWVFGAVDPLSGSAALTEITRVFGLMLSKGHRPRRTVVFCSWDAEEYGLVGSVEWVEDHLKVLHQRGVALLNLDYAAVSNYSLAVGTSPLLQDALYAAAKKVPSPDPSVGETLYDLWTARPIKKMKDPSPDPYVTYSLGSGSDMAAFYQRAGVPSVDMWMTYNEIEMPLSSYPLYHSSHETFFAYDTFIDPGFSATNTITQFMAILACDLACTELLPMDVQRYSAAVSNFHQTLINSFGDKWQKQNVNIEAFDSSVQNFTAATKAFQDILDADKETILKSPLDLRRINDQLMLLERAFLNPEGLPGRPSQKHVMFAPSQFDSYVDNSFPGIMDTMYEIDHGDEGKWEQLKQQVFIATHIIQSAASTLEDIGL
ncbi:N-acetylated-alpha-linked acidic dipeptidase 2-like [Littorina saxatilis]|uniref:Aminopeptidase NAALADL1 n=1 Tax=Littorina saxatilis TaxID=31220 RepID=A0AAN9C1E2_9CAEN